MQGEQQVVIVGAGGAGLLAAWRASSLGAPVLLVERNRKPGIKLLISGGGKCNITHAGPLADLLGAFRQHEARFLKPSFHRFTNQQITTLLEERGVRTYVRPNGRVFPVSGRADDVVEALMSALPAGAVRFRPLTRVERVLAAAGAITGIEAAGTVIPTSHLIVATGGASYPKTGTTGDAFGWMAALGHTIVPLRPALAPIGIRPPLPDDWRGVALREGALAISANGRRLASWRGDVLFTHEGLSGPAALELSRPAAVALENAAVHVDYDFFPDEELAALDARLNAQVQQQRDRTIATLLNGWLPNRIVPQLLHAVEVPPSTRGHVLTAMQRRAVARLLKAWRIGEVSHIRLERGEVTAGGIALQEVDPHSMRSRKVRGLYLCGELLDIAGPVGGYNLQAAFSTGWVAGESAAQDLLGRQPGS